MHKLLTIIIPVYNVEKYLEKCLKSIVEEKDAILECVEIIVIDDGSTDETCTIIDTYAARDARIVAVHQANFGLVAAREKGINMATGDYIGFVDGDDIIESDMYERLVRNAMKYDADISHCGVSFIWPNSHTEAHYGTGKIIEQDNFTGVCDLLLGEQIEPSLCNKIKA